MILFDKIIFGPIQSRRLGVSLGVNLLPLDIKVCNYDCIYCECGYTDLKNGKKHFHSRAEVFHDLEEALVELKNKKTNIDAITFAGNGEPAMHPQFDKIIDDVIDLRNRYFKKAKVAVLSNAAFLNNQKVVDALMKVDLPILKLDAGNEETFKEINRPLARRSLRWIVDHIQYFKGKLIIQSMFLKGNYEGKIIDNSTDKEVSAWLELIKEIRPLQVMIYSLDRETPMKGLEKIPVSRLEEIARKVEATGIKTMVC